MKVDELEKIINGAFEDRMNISETSDQKILDAIIQTIDLTDKGSIRVAEKKNGNWSVNQWVKKAIFLTQLGMIKFLENQLVGMKQIGKKLVTDTFQTEL